MAAAVDPPARAAPNRRSLQGLHGWAMRLVARPGFQRWAARFPLTRGFARRDGAALFDMVQGFVQAQVLYALVTLEIPDRLAEGPLQASEIARQTDIPADRMAILLQAGAALGLLRRRRDGRFGLARRGAALLGVPGLRRMILHHDVFYRDLADPVALLRGEMQTELAEFWPYVFGAGAVDDPDRTAIYSDLMAESQELVAEDTLAQAPLRGARRLLDVGGGSGAFAIAAAHRNPDLAVRVLDLPGVRAAAEARIAGAGLSDRITFMPGSFRDAPLPGGADAISLVRVLYDHGDDTVTPLLNRAFDALDPGGLLVISEPMSGGDMPDRAGDVYFAFYTMAMQTGQARSAARIAALCTAAGFADITCHRTARPYVTSVLTARKPAAP